MNVPGSGSRRLCTIRATGSAPAESASAASSSRSSSADPGADADQHGPLADGRPPGGGRAATRGSLGPSWSPASRSARRGRADPASARTHRGAELAEQVVQPELGLGGLAPVADDQPARAGRSSRPGTPAGASRGRRSPAAAPRRGARPARSPGHVDHRGVPREDHARRRARPRARTRTPSTTMHRDPMNAPSSTITGVGLDRLEHAADPDAAGQVDVGADLRARARPSPTCRPCVPGPTQAPMFT